jgi:ABC-type multidrug transport system fused ATPase/permease subunit
VGTILISFGYKYKLRLDYIIIGILLAIFILKIGLYGGYFFKQNEMYTTTDYYFFDFGIHVLNPLYNITYFLIGMYFGLINYSIQKGITDLYSSNTYKKYIPLKESKPDTESNQDSDMGSNLLLYINTDNSESSLDSEQEKNRNKKDNDINKDSNEKLEKLMTNDETNKEKNEEIKEYKDQVKKMPFLITPILFYRFNKDKKDKLWYNILIFVAIIILGLLCFSKTIFLHALSLLDEESSTEEYMSELSLEKTISNEALNVIYLFDVEIVVILSQWIIFILFFKEATMIRTFCNSIYWSFFVKSYYPFTLVSIPIILLIFYESESVIKIHIYNFILYSFINLIFVFIYVIIFYSIYDLPLKKIFKYFLKGSEIMEEEEEDSDEEEEEKEKEEEALEVDDDEEEMKSLKS